MNLFGPFVTDVEWWYTSGLTSAPVGGIWSNYVVPVMGFLGGFIAVAAACYLLYSLCYSLFRRVPTERVAALLTSFLGVVQSTVVGARSIYVGLSGVVGGFFPAAQHYADALSGHYRAFRRGSVAYRREKRRFL